MTLIISLEQ